MCHRFVLQLAHSVKAAHQAEVISVLIVGADSFNQAHPFSETQRFVQEWTLERNDNFWQKCPSSYLSAATYIVHVDFLTNSSISLQTDGADYICWFHFEIRYCGPPKWCWVYFSAVLR